MAALGVTAATDIASLALIWYVKGKALTQTTQDKPLLKWLRDNKKTFKGGNLQISEPIQINYMSDVPGFVQGFSQDDSINFPTTSNVLRVVYNWKETITSLLITWTDLLIDGISIIDDSRGSNKVRDHDSETRLTGLMENRIADWGESDARGYNLMYWQDGSQDPKQVPGIFSIILDNPAVGSTGGLSRATYAAWRNRANLTLTASAQNSTLIQFFNTELLQLKRFGGKPNKALCGAAFIDALRLELFAKGYFTQDGFMGEKATDLGMNNVHITGLGKFEYDPTLDNLGFSKRCYVLDSDALRLWAMEGEDQKMLDPVRPYQYLVDLHSKKCTGAIVARRLNSLGVYAIS